MSEKIDIIASGYFRLKVRSFEEWKLQQLQEVAVDKAMYQEKIFFFETDSQFSERFE